MKNQRYNLFFAFQKSPVFLTVSEQLNDDPISKSEVLDYLESYFNDFSSCLLEGHCDENLLFKVSLSSSFFFNFWNKCFNDSKVKNFFSNLKYLYKSYSYFGSVGAIIVGQCFCQISDETFDYIYFFVKPLENV